MKSPEAAFEMHKAKVSPFTTSYPIFIAGWNAALASHSEAPAAPAQQASDWGDHFDKQVVAAVAKEREACAVVCDGFAQNYSHTVEEQDVAQGCAATIRERNNAEKPGKTGE